MDIHTIDISPVSEVEYDMNGQPEGITVGECMDRLERKLINLYGEDFRNMLNQARAERDLYPL